VTAEEIVEAALVECEALGAKFHTGSRIPMYRHLTTRQQELFSLAGSWNEDYVGWQATGQVTAGQSDLRDLRRDDHPTVPGIERIVRVEVSDPGTSTLTAGAEVHIVRKRSEAFSAPSPRALLRSAILTGYGAELNGVAEVEVFYVRIPRPLEDDNDEAELVGGHADLLVIDLARWLILASTDESIQKVAGAAVAQLTSHEKDLLSAFEAHVREFSPDSAEFDL
jgi:hypothetical protein